MKKSYDFSKAERDLFINRFKPNNPGIEEQYQRYVITKVEHGLTVADAKGALSYQEVEKRLQKWTDPCRK